MAISDHLRVAGRVDLSTLDPEGTPGLAGGKKDVERATADLADELARLQTKLFAQGYTDGHKRVLLVVQGMDTSGKGGVLKQCVGAFDPGGVRLKSFKKPTEEELAHDFLWRVDKEVPAAGYVGIFDRSHYEDVLVARVLGLAESHEVERRYDAINAFEQRLTAEGTTIVKCMLHISREEQRRRLLARLDDPTKQWKYKPEDVDARVLWDDYQRSYEIALERCSTEAAPWHVVPSNKKWYRTWAVSNLLADAMRDLDLDWPRPSYDLETERDRVETS